MNHGFGLLVYSRLRPVNLHLITVITLNAFGALSTLSTFLVDILLLQDLLLALALNVDTTLVRQVLFVGSLDPVHMGVPAAVESLCLFFVGKLVGAVLFLIGDEISLGLLRRELGWRRSLGIPAR